MNSHTVIRHGLAVRYWKNMITFPDRWAPSPWLIIGAIFFCGLLMLRYCIRTWIAKYPTIAAVSEAIIMTAMVLYVVGINLCPFDKAWGCATLPRYIQSLFSH